MMVKLNIPMYSLHKIVPQYMLDHLLNDLSRITLLSITFTTEIKVSVLSLTCVISKG